MKDDLGNRMKRNYEQRAQTSLLRRSPVIIRVDGVAFHTFCKRFVKPYDYGLHFALNKTMEYLCKNIQGAKFAERHSDEISILVTDYDSISTDAFFDYTVQKICSVVASWATAEFCRILAKEQNVLDRPRKCVEEIYKKDVLNWNGPWPVFDARCFNVPVDEIGNYFLWRQKDALRNGLSMLARSHFSHKELNNKSGSDMQEMLFSIKGINWNDIPQEQKTGYVCRKVPTQIVTQDGCVSRNKWKTEPSPAQKSELDDLIENVFKPKEQL